MKTAKEANSAEWQIRTAASTYEGVNIARSNSIIALSEICRRKCVTGKLDPLVQLIRGQGWPIDWKASELTFKRTAMTIVTHLVCCPNPMSMTGKHQEDCRPYCRSDEVRSKRSNSRTGRSKGPHHPKPYCDHNAQSREIN